MKKFKAYWKEAGCVVMATSMMFGMTVTTGCTNSALGLQDYQRDLLTGVGALAIAMLRDAPQGPQGEVGPVGPAGPDGQLDGEAAAGAPGEPGLPGTACWDLNGNNINDAEEDTNGDGVFDTLDCSGADGDNGSQGSQGPDGSDGADGADGPGGYGLTSLWIDDFFTNVAPSGDMPVQVVEIVEPSLPADDIIAFRIAVPEGYDESNQMSMRLFFYRTGYQPEGCMVFQLDAARLQNGSGIAVYGSTRYINVEPSGDVYDDGMLVVVDVPIDSYANGLGLNFPALASQQFIAFELQVASVYGNDYTLSDGGDWELLGVEVYEEATGSLPEFPAVDVSTDEGDALEGCGYYETPV